MTAAHPARVGRTRLDAGYLPERGGKRRRMRVTYRSGVESVGGR